MTESLGAGLLFAVLLGSTALGLFARPFLSEAHRSRETTDFVQGVVIMPVTFLAVVLGLLTSAAKESSDRVGNELKGLSVALIQLDRSLREWGSEAEPARHQLREYTAAVIASSSRGRGTGRGRPQALAFLMITRPQSPARSAVRLWETCYPASSSKSAAWSQRIRCSGCWRQPASPSSNGSCRYTGGSSRIRVARSRRRSI